MRPRSAFPRVFVDAAWIAPRIGAGTMRSHALRSRARARLPRPLATLAALAAIVGGCNTILDNQPARLDPDALSIGPPSQALTDSGADAFDAGPAVDTGASECAPGTHACDGVCVREDDPAYGCGDPSCTPCSNAHGTPACSRGVCVLASCDPGRADCNRDAGDGCEIDLSKATSCGRCGVACPASDPYCQPAADTFECTNGCTADAPLLCGTECVSPLTSVNHCGACDHPCPDVPNAQISCGGGKCAFSCRAGYHACGAGCAIDSDPKACGPSCSVCPTAANATAICTSNACALQCKTGFANCNQDATDGCEAKLATDPLHCGGCNVKCAAVANATVSCSGGACTFACNPGYHACAGACVSDTDPTACGPTCAVCAVPANARATCSANACGSTCNAGFADCNVNPVDGCETNLMTDLSNCGGCGTVCAGSCVNGLCVPAP